MIITEKRIIRQEWYETEYNKNGWDSHGWYFKDDGKEVANNWVVTEHLQLDKFGNPITGVAEKQNKI